MTLRRSLTSISFAGLLALGVSTAAFAEGQLRIVEQFGTGYLPLHVLRDKGLIEKHGKLAGIDIKVEWAKLSGGAAINDALLSGAVDIGAAGAGPVIVLWDRTRGNAGVKIIAALGEQPNYLARALVQEPQLLLLEWVNTNIVEAETLVQKVAKYSDQIRDQFIQQKRTYRLLPVTDKKFVAELQTAADWLAERKVLPEKITVTDHLANV